jgi:UDP-N-acetylglucosamine 2-epimerase (non-hydrolysing)
MREVTERPEGLAGGCLKLVGCSVERIVTEARRLLDDPVYYEESIRGNNPYGDGRAAQRVVEALKYFLGRDARRPEDFGGIA